MKLSWSQSDGFVRKAAETVDGEFQLEERIVAYVEDHSDYIDIHVNDALVSHNAIEKSEPVGVEREWPFVCIDSVRVPAKGNASPAPVKTEEARRT